MDLSMVNDDYYLSGVATLLNNIDKQLMIILRDGRTLIACLRSLDQFGNLVLHQAFERIIVGRQYADIPRGIYVIRGENVLLIAEIDYNRPLTVSLNEVSIEEIFKLQRDDIEKKERIQKLRREAMIKHGLVDDGNPIEEQY